MNWDVLVPEAVLVVVLVLVMVVAVAAVVVAQVIVRDPAKAIVEEVVVNGVVTQDAVQTVMVLVKEVARVAAVGK